MLLQIEERDVVPGLHLVEMKGKLALGRESQRIETLVDDMTKAGRLRAIFDMSQVDYIDSAGIGMLALVSGKLKETGGQLAIVAPGGRVLDMLKLTQMDKVLRVCGSMAEAVSFFGESATA